jgi:hypothetical protein
MRAQVTADGLLIPKPLLEGMRDVEIHKEHDCIVIVPCAAADPILQLGVAPVVTEDCDASEHHDRYLY